MEQKESRYRVIKTDDGSDTLHVDKIDEHYHSDRGAIGESMHVFIEAGYNSLNGPEVSILEIGFGTGLNALLTAIRSKEREIKTRYVAIEKYPLPQNLALSLNYPELLSGDSEEYFKAIHTSSWEEPFQINSQMQLTKRKCDLLTCKLEGEYNLIYYDAFAPSKQPEMWSHDLIEKVISLLLPGGVFVTYSARGELRRSLQSLGMSVERLPGATGKREMIRARCAHTVNSEARLRRGDG